MPLLCMNLSGVCFVDILVLCVATEVRILIYRQSCTKTARSKNTKLGTQCSRMLQYNTGEYSIASKAVEEFEGRRENLT
jgi:hypothetical protein